MRRATWLCCLAVAGCTSEARYDAARQSGEQHARCSDIVNQDQRAECEAAFAVPYREYLEALRDIESAPR